MTTRIHPSTPPRLVREFRKAGSFHKLAEQLDVNVKYIHDLINKGIEPADSTPTLRMVRHKLHLPKRKRRNRPRPQAEPQPEHTRWWRRLPKESREKIISRLHAIHRQNTGEPL
jgi:hypothetical protein